MVNVPEIFGSAVFNDSMMKKYLPAEIYDSLKNTVQKGARLDPQIADAVAAGMKDWAIGLGATHFTHWFQPMTGITAEKHDSFLEKQDDSHVIMRFSGKNLVSGEADASSFPSGGLRATFEARGYSAWDPTSYAFVKDGTLCIPTAFCSYRGESLDKKTPLLRSMEALERQAARILRLFGESGDFRVFTEAGVEQEYFLLDKAAFEKRPDLVYCGRTLFGARPPKGQEMDDHYYGQIKPRVQAFMKDLDEELWKLGVLAKTEHNEAAPAQHEIAPIYTTVNIATDHNQLTMEMLKKVALRHGLACLLHEKPFAGINGSGKHLNWSISTDTGLRLLKPGKTPAQNARFLLFLTAVIKAVDENQDLLRISVSSAANDHRLGGNEAPPAIISIFLGDDLMAILEDIMSGTTPENRPRTKLNIGASVLPELSQDTTDRNRTSPFAFTGNKFEFRSPGSSMSIACPCMILNTIVADVLGEFADELEKSTDFHRDLDLLIHRTLLAHRRILFNGNNYSKKWVEEAEKRGLLNLSNSVDALRAYTDDKNVALFERQGVLTGTEIASRKALLLENYSKTILIEALTLTDLVRKDILPAALRYENDLLEVRRRKAEHPAKLSTAMEDQIITRLSALTEGLWEKLEKLETDLVSARSRTAEEETARFCRETIFPDMAEIRLAVDELETCTDRRYWPVPTYAELLYSVK